MSSITRRVAMFAVGALALTMTTVSEAAEDTATLGGAKGSRIVSVAASFEPVTRLASREGGQLTQVLSVDGLLLAPVFSRWNLYAGVGVGFFNARLRAGIDVVPLGRTRSGPVLMLGGRAVAGFLLMDSPGSDAPPTATGGPPVTWSYTALLAEAGIGYRFRTGKDNPDVTLAPTFLGGRVHYATGGGPGFASFGPIWKGDATYLGGTLAIALEW